MASYAKGIPRNQESHRSNEREILYVSPGAQAQNTKAARVYIFGDGNAIDNEDDEFVEYEMRSRHQKTAFPSSFQEEPKQDFFEREIHDGETLQAIALKYACNVSDLKRLNNLIQDQEFFALKRVKVPITRYGVLSESAEAQQSSKAVSTYTNGAMALSDGEDDGKDFLYDSESQHDFSDPEMQMKVMKTLSIGENISKQSKEAKIFLRKMDEDLSKLKKPPREERESLSEVISFLTNKSIRPLDRTVNNNNNKHNGADCGMSWWSVLVCMLGVSILVPLFFLVYYYFLKS